MVYRVFHPATELSHIVDYYWYAKIDLEKPVRQQYATPLLEGLAFNFNRRTEQHAFNDRTLTLEKSAYFFGQPTSPRIVTTNEKGIDLIGVKFKPLGIPKITGIKMAHFSDAIIAAEDIWGAQLESLCDAMQSAGALEKALNVLEGFLIRKCAHTTLNYRVNHVQKALQLIKESKGNIDVKNLQIQTNTTRKTLERAFVDYLGIQPKLYLRIVRFNAVKAIMDRAITDRPVGTSLALDFGYYDSSHFISEFKRFSGATPQQYLKTTPLQLVFKDS